MLCRGGAVEDHRVGAGLAFDGVAAIARIPHERVVARAQLREVVAPVAVDRVVAVAAAQLLHPGAAGEIVVSVSAVERRRDAVGEDTVALVDAHEVVTGAAVDDDPRDELALDAEIGRAVVADVDLEDVRSAGLQAKRNPVARARALDDQRAVLQFGALEHDVAVPIRAAPGLVGRGGVGRHGRDPACAGDYARHGHCHARKPRRANVVGSKSILHLYVLLVRKRVCVSMPRTPIGDAYSRPMLTDALAARGRLARWNAHLTQLGCGDHLDRLYRAAWALCGSREDAEDLVQETYARVLGRGRPLGHADDLCSRRTPRCTTDRA